MKLKMDQEVWKYSFEGRYQFPSPLVAKSVSNALIADAELQPDLCVKTAYYENCMVTVEMYSKDPKVMRKSLSGIFRSIILCSRAFQQLHRL